MSLDTNGIFDALTSHAASLGIFEIVQMHEPKMSPGSGLCFALWCASISPSRSGLNSTSVQVVFEARIYVSMLQEPQDGIDSTIMSAVDALMDAYNGDFDLGNEVRNIDIFGEEGTKLTAVAGYINQDNKLYRVMTITIPVIVNDVWSQVP